MSEIRVAAALIRNGNELLMGRRLSSAHSAHSGFWEFPGGKIEAGESPEEAIKREVFEELGAHVLQCRPYQNLEWQYPQRTVHLHFFWVEIDVLEINKLQMNAHSELKWMSPQAALREKTLPANLQLLRELTAPEFQNS